MKQIVLTGGAALLLGVVVGLAAMHSYLSQNLAAAQASLSALRAASADQAGAVEQAEARYARLEADYARVREEAESLRQALAAGGVNEGASERPQGAAAAPEGEADPAFNWFEVLPPDDLKKALEGMDGTGAAGATAADVPGAGTEAGAPGTSEVDAAGSHKDRAAERVKAAIDAALEAELQASRGAAAQERISALLDYSDAIFDLRSRIRAAETPEERQALRAEMNQYVRDAQQLLRQQQRDMLRDVGQDYGIDNGQSMQGFVNQMEQTLRSPFFNPSQFVGGKNPNKPLNVNRGLKPQRVNKPPKVKGEPKHAVVRAS